MIYILALVKPKPRSRRFTTGNERFYAKLRSFEIKNIDTTHLALHVSSKAVTLNILATLISDIILYRLTTDIQCHIFSG